MKQESNQMNMAGSSIRWSPVKNHITNNLKLKFQNHT